MELNIDYVLCPICHKKFAELNTAHLRKHNLSIHSFDKQYPGYIRISAAVLKKKSHFKILTPEMSKKLSKSHTLQGFIEKYGTIEGPEKYNKTIQKMKFSRSLEGYIQRYGEQNGPKIKIEHDNRRAVTKEKLIKKYGEMQGLKKWQSLVNRNTLQTYINKYGEVDGVKFWIKKYDTHSQKVRKIPIDKINKYLHYCRLVDRFTRLSLTMFPLINIEKRNKQFHLDHKVSKCYGFLHNIDPKYIGSIYNLEILSAKANNSKQAKCSMDPLNLILAVDAV